MTDAATLAGPASLQGPYSPCATYFVDSDCVEYVQRDEFCIYDRVDNFLTLIFDETGLDLVGFKLKGFKHLFETQLRPLYELNDMQFIDLVSAIEAYFTHRGNQMFASSDPKLRGAYKAALKLAANDNVRLAGNFLSKAA
jgi:hypothetical protein